MEDITIATIITLTEILNSNERRINDNNSIRGQYRQQQREKQQYQQERVTG